MLRKIVTHFALYAYEVLLAVNARSRECALIVARATGANDATRLAFPAGIKAAVV